MFLATASTSVLTAGTAAKLEMVGKVLHIYGKTKAVHHCGNYCTFWDHRIPRIPILDYLSRQNPKLYHEFSQHLINFDFV